MEPGLVEGADCIILHPSIFGSLHFPFHFINTRVVECQSVEKLSIIQMLGVKINVLLHDGCHEKEAMIKSRPQSEIHWDPALVTGTDEIKGLHHLLNIV